MSEDLVWKIIYWLSVLAIAAVALSVRYAYVARTRGWVEVEGTITDVSSVIRGDIRAPIIDVAYEYGTYSFTAFELDTGSGDFHDYVQAERLRCLSTR